MNAVRRLRSCVLGMALLLAPAVLPERAFAQCTANARSDVSVSPPVITLQQPTIAELDAGMVVYQGTVLVQVTSQQGNRPWVLCVRSLNPDLGTVDGSVKPTTDLELQVGTVWLAVLASDQTLLEGRGSSTHLLGVRMRVAWGVDPPGTFGTDLRFTVQ